MDSHRPSTWRWARPFFSSGQGSGWSPLKHSPYLFPPVVAPGRRRKNAFSPRRTQGAPVPTLLCLRPSGSKQNLFPLNRRILRCSSRRMPPSSLRVIKKSGFRNLHGFPPSKPKSIPLRFPKAAPHPLSTPAPPPIEGPRASGP